MTRFKLSALSLLSVCVASFGTGCHEQPPAQVKATAPAATPEESFKEITQLVKDGIEMRGDDAARFVTQESGARTQFAVYNTVTSEIVPPAQPTDAYRATITVTSRSVYSLRLSAEEAAEKEAEENAAKRDGFSLMDDAADDDSGFEVMDRDLISASPDGEKADGAVDERVNRRADEDVRTYDFAYENGRWVLKTKLDLKTEKSVQNAIERALRLQL